MTVRELIEHLQTLDQDRGVWVCYDTFCWFPPVPDDTATMDFEVYGDVVKKGDYVITAG